MATPAAIVVVFVQRFDFLHHVGTITAACILHTKYGPGEDCEHVSIPLGPSTLSVNEFNAALIAGVRAYVLGRYGLVPANNEILLIGALTVLRG